MEEKTASIKKSPFVPILVIVVIALSFVAGSLWQKVKILEKGGAVAGTGTDTTGNAPAKNNLSIDNLKAYAKELKLDTNKFNNCLDSGDKKSVVDNELKEGESKGVTGTPGFLMNGHLIGGAMPFEIFKQIIDYELSSGFDSATYPDNIQKLITDGYISKEKTEANIGTSPSKGANNAKITLVEFSDFQCPFCVRAYPTVKQILQAYPNDVKLVYKHYPLSSIHPFAQKAAEASVCALDQGKFWEYHDKLFESAA